jgi:hypothetical protein
MAINCTTGDNVLPEVEFNEDCGTESYASEIEELFIAQADAVPFTDWADPTEWATRLSQSSVASGNEIRRLTGVGDKPAAQDVIVNVSKRRKKKLDATHQINFDVDDVSSKNYDAFRTFQKGVYKRVWVKNRAPNMFGGNEGIKAFIQATFQMGRGDEIEKITLTITWNDKQDPERIVSPI